MKKVSKKLALLVCLCAMNSAYAAEADVENLSKYEGEEYVVTATRTELTEKENPRSVEVITREEIENIGAISVRDALRLATNLNIQGTGGNTGDNILIRGNDDVLIMVNGRRYASEGAYAFTSQNAFTLDRFNINNVERIEILRGQDASIYGSGAQGGIINIITKKSEKEAFTVGVTTGTREMSNYYRWDTGKQGKLSATFDVNFSKLRNIDSKTDGDHLLYGPKQNYTLDLDYDMDENNSLNLFLDYSKDNLERYNTSSMMGFKQTGVLPFTSERKTAALTYNGKNENNDYSFSVTYSHMDRDTAINDSPNTTGQREYSTLNFEARDAIQTSENNKLVVGAEYRKDRATIFGSNEQKGVDQYAAYLHDEYYVTDKLLLTPSIRYDHHESFGSNTSPSIGATYFIADNSRFKASYNTGYRAPAIDELYGVFDHGGMFQMFGMLYYGNPDLKPEKTRGYELSYEHEFGKDTSARLTYFNNKKKDAITEMQILGTSDYTWTNVDEATYEGVEFEVSHDLGNGFVLSGSYDWLDATDKSDDSQILYTARNTYTAKLSWTEPVNKEWNVTAWNRWYTDYAYGSGHSGSDKALASINTFNFAVSKRWGDKYRVFAGVDNVFDKEFSDMNYYGRMWRVGAEMTF